jgi:DivIVA domain-containing protein
MTYQFELAPEKKLGYDINQVNAFITLARQQFQDETAQVLTSAEIRRAEFDLARGGYQIRAVDKAIERLEDAFVAREIQRERNLIGTANLNLRMLEIRAALDGRLGRRSNRRFSRVSWPLRGYNRAQVDTLCEFLSAHLEGKGPFDLMQARNAIFKPARGGYVEGQVDAFIDRAVELLQLQKSR